ncbi:MAG: response regulator [Gammaproteobacteria bacterium]|nr:response regulator [Gammaproteobacteria bacterium]
MSIEIEKLRFLIIDDYADMRGVLRNMLLSFGVVGIDSVSNGKEAIHNIETQRYDVILCDYNLGEGRDGQQVLEEIRHRKLIGVSTIFIMVTAENTRVMVMGAVEYEPDSYLSKPFTKDLLGQRLSNLLNMKADLVEIEHAIDAYDFDLANRLIDIKLEQKSRNHNILVRLKAELAIQERNYKEAAKIYENILSNREIVWAKLGLGKAKYYEEDYIEAKKIFSELIRDNERFMAAYDWLAKTQQMLDELKDAQEVLRKGVTLSAKAIPRQQALAELAMRNGDEKTAEKALGQAITLGKHSIYKHPSMFSNIAQLKAKRGLHDEAKWYVKEIAKNFKDDQEGKLYTAISNSLILEDAEAAKKNMQIASDLFHELDGQVSPQIAVDMAKACSHSGNEEMAKEILHQAASNNHTDAEALRDISDTMGDLKLEKDPKKIISKIKNKVVALNNDGAKLVRSGKLAEAMQLFEEAAEGMPANIVVNLNAARTFLMFMEQTGPTMQLANKLHKFLSRVEGVEPDNRAFLRLKKRAVGLIDSAG